MFFSDSVSKNLVKSYNDQYRIFNAGSGGTRRHNFTTKTSSLSGKKTFQKGKLSVPGSKKSFHPWNRELYSQGSENLLIEYLIQLRKYFDVI